MKERELASISPPVAVIGAGVVGLSTALYLQRAGRRRDSDRSAAAGGRRLLRQCRPDQRRHLGADRPAGHAAQGAGLADRPLGPLVVRPALLPEGAALAAALDRGRAGCRACSRSPTPCARCTGRLRVLEGIAGPSRVSTISSARTGQVHVWEGEAETPGAALERQLRERQGITSRAAHGRRPAADVPGHLPANAARRAGPGQRLHREPAPHRRARSANCSVEAGGEMVAERAYEDHAARGRRLRRHDERRLPLGQRGRRRRRARGRGSCSTRLASGCRWRPSAATTPCCRHPASRSTLPISNKTRSFGVTPMEHGLRVAGTVEIAGLDAPPDERRAKVLLEHVRRHVPRRRRAEDHRFWMGFRPSTPDSLPILGQAPGRPGLFLVFGHGHFGMTGGPPSARAVARLITGDTPGLDLAPYAPTRFARAPKGRAVDATRDLARAAR